MRWWLRRISVGFGARLEGCSNENNGRVYLSLFRLLRLASLRDQDSAPSLEAATRSVVHFFGACSSFLGSSSRPMFYSPGFAGRVCTTLHALLLSSFPHDDTSSFRARSFDLIRLGLDCRFRFSRNTIE